MAEEKGFKHIIRVVNTDLDGNKSIINSLRKIKGVSFMFANMACKLTGIDKKKKTGMLSEKEVSALESFFNDPLKHNVPEWALNRQKDPYDGKSTQLLSTDIKFVQDNDIKILKKIKSYRGSRHAAGLPARGQKTKSNFRRNKGGHSGVKKKQGKKSGK